MLLVICISCIGCEEEARQFDFTKKLDFVYHHTQTTTLFDSLGFLKVVDHKSLNDYREYAQDYFINGFSYSVQQEPGNSSSAGKVTGSYLIVNDTIELFTIESLDFTGKELVIPLSGVQLDELSSMIKDHKNLQMIMSYDMDQSPVHIEFILTLDLTVAVQFDF
ncbi:MAG: hypothetical protein RIC35_09750 [Marinoscillum sp.]